MHSTYPRDSNACSSTSNYLYYATPDSKLDNFNSEQYNKFKTNKHIKLQNSQNCTLLNADQWSELDEQIKQISLDDRKAGIKVRRDQDFSLCYLKSG